MTDLGFSLGPEPDAPACFNRLVEQVMDEAGEDYIALPVTDGATGYDRVFIIPLD